MKKASLNTCKILMVFFNLGFFMCGCILLGIGLWGFIAKESFSKIISSDPAITNTVVIMMFAGTVLIIEGFFGCSGAIRESKCLLAMFVILTMLLFLVEVAAIVFVNMYYPKVLEFVRDSIPEGYQKSELTKQLWDSIQSTFECCGIEDYRDWTHSNGTYPHSCCKEIPPACNPIDNKSFYYVTGCEDGVINHVWLIYMLVAATLTMEICGIVFSCCLCSNITEKLKEDY